jgi:hypothetical protein
MSNVHQRITQEIETLGGYRTFYNAAARTKNPNGLHRLAHLVPEVAPDQESLARMLAEYALYNRRSDLNDEIPLAVHMRFQRAKDQPLSLLVREARSSSKDAWIAWQACELFLEDAAREKLIESESGLREKVIEPIPMPIMDLMKDHFCGRIQRATPQKTGLNPAKRALRDDAIRFAIWLTLEADITATSRDPAQATACNIVADILGVGSPGIAEIWKGRKIKGDKGGGKGS